MYGPGKLKSYSPQLTDSGPVFARVAVRHTLRMVDAAGSAGPTRLDVRVPVPLEPDLPASC